VSICAGDSVAFLHAFADSPPAALASLDLLYLDSFDHDYANPLPSSLHLLKELVAAAPLLHAGTLVVVNDSPLSVHGVPLEDGRFHLVMNPTVGGKGRLVAEYAAQIGAEPLFQGYQCGWTKFRSGARTAQVAPARWRGVITESQQGTFAVDVEDEFVGKALRDSGAYGLDEIEQALSHISKDDNVLVVGAHVAAIAVSLARRCARLTAIEANPRTYKLLLCNLILNSSDNVTAHNFAANDRDETIRFVMNTHNSGGSKRFPLHPHPAYFHDNPEVVEVRAHSLDEKLDRHDYDLVFMDIEGSEYMALKGMPRILEHARCLIVEFLPHHLTNVAGVTPEEFVATLAPYFDSLFIPSRNIRVAKEDFATVLRQMHDSGQGDMGLVFTKPGAYIP